MKTTILIPLLMLCAVIVGPATAQDDVAEGRKLLEAGDHAAAAEKFRGVLAKNEDHFEARFGMAEAKLGAGEFDSAVYHAVKAEKIRPDDAAAIELTGKAFKAVGDTKLANGEDPTGSYAEAIVSYAKLAEKKPKDAAHHATLGYLYFYSNRLEDSGKSYAAAAALDKKNSEYAYLGAQSYNLGQMLGEAGALIDMAIARDKDVARYHMMRGQILGNMQKLVDAGDAFGAALVAKDVTPELSNAAASSMWNCYSPSKTWKPYAERLAGWTKKDRKNPFAWWWLGYVQLQDGDFDAAYKSYGQANKVSEGGWAEALFYQGMARKAQGKEDDALKLFKKAGSMPYQWAQNFGPAFEMQVMMGQAYGKPDYKRAVEIAEDYCLPIVTGAERVMILGNLALFHRDWGGKEHSDESRDYYEEAIELAEKTDGMDKAYLAQLFNDTAIVYQYARRHFYSRSDGIDRALKYLERALEYDETNSDVCLNYGLILRDKGKPKEALEIVKKGVPRSDLDQLRRELESQVGQ